MLIGLTGKMGSGKSTVAHYLTQKYAFVEYALAQPLKEIAMIFGFTHDEVYIHKNAISPTLQISARKFLQTFGTEIVRDQFKVFFPDTPLETSQWIRLMKKFVVEHYHTGTGGDACVCISDIRFPDEATALRELGEQLNQAVLIIQLRRSCKDVLPEHVSEICDDILCDYSLENSGTKEELFDALDTIIR